MSACLLNFLTTLSSGLSISEVGLEFIMLKYHFLLSAAGLLTASFVFAQQHSIASLTENSHVCNTEAEIARLAQNEQLQEMARALVEFKPTQYCFILPDAANVPVLEQQAGYIKFDYKSQVLYTFSKYVTTTTTAVNGS
jgi:hypothetical protein